MEAYTDFAAVYDTFMDETPYEEWAAYLCACMERYGISRPSGAAVQEEAEAGRETAQNGEPPQNRETAQNGEPPQNREAARSGEPPQNRETAQSGEPPRDQEREERLREERNLVLDLGCGTGTLTRLLAQRGYDMIGVDNAPAMLSIAIQKSREAGLSSLYLLQDMRRLELYSTVGTIISVCDSLNYILEEEELLQVFRLVDNYLYPGGLFLFDFNTAYKYEQVIGDTTIAENREECSFIWENCYDGDTQINEYGLTVFLREEGGMYRRFEEYHYQRGYTLAQMRRLVKEAGLTLIRAEDADTHEEVTDRSERIYLLATH